NLFQYLGKQGQRNNARFPTLLMAPMNLAAQHKDIWAEVSRIIDNTNPSFDAVSRTQQLVDVLHKHVTGTVEVGRTGTNNKVASSRKGSRMLRAIAHTLPSPINVIKTPINLVRRCS